MADPERASWIRTFRTVDADGSGYVDERELKACLVALGQPHSDDDVSCLLRAAGIAPSDDLRIDQETFLRLVGAGDGGRELEHAEVLQMYHSIDIDASGYISAAELQHFMGNLGMFLDDRTMSGLMGMYDADGNGRITFDEFRDLVVDLGFSVKLDPEEGEYEAQDDGPFDNYTENVMKVKSGGDAAVADAEDSTAVTADTESLAATSHEEETPADDEEEKRGKMLSLSSIADDDLREALAPFDADGSGTIDLARVRAAAEGRGPARLHWSDDRPKVGLAEHVRQVNHIAILVSDVSRSLRFYGQVMGFEQIRRPNFDAHGAWLTMGNCELHLIKGKPIVHAGDDLVVGHISIDAVNVRGVLDKLQKMNVPFRKNSSVPAGADAGGMNTNANDDMMSDRIVTQFFIRDPDGYYLEICNCDETLTKYSLGEKDTLPGYEEGVEPLSFATASTTINLVQRWVAKLEAGNERTKRLSARVKEETDGSVEEIARLLEYKKADEVDAALLRTLKDRHSIYGDVWQNEEVDDIEGVLKAAGNDPKAAETIVKLRTEFNGRLIYRPPVVFEEDGTKYFPEPIVTDLAGKELTVPKV